MTELHDLESFKQLVGAIEPWLTKVVIVGGWAHYLYRAAPSCAGARIPSIEDPRHGRCCPN
jgi:hypothetical protein